MGTEDAICGNHKYLTLDTVRRLKRVDYAIGYWAEQQVDDFVQKQSQFDIIS